MNDFKSKLPDLKELASMTNKLVTDIKKSISDIVKTYKQNRTEGASENGTIKSSTKTKTKRTTGSTKPTKTTRSDDNNKK